MPCTFTWVPGSQEAWMPETPTLFLKYKEKREKTRPLFLNYQEAKRRGEVRSRNTLPIIASESQHLPNACTSTLLQLSAGEPRSKENAPP